MGHGTHTATTAAGSLEVVHPGLIWPCTGHVGAAADQLKAFNEAIYDGVDVLSLSMGNYLPKFAESHAIKIDVYYGTPQVTFGGIALKFFASIRLEIRSTGKIEFIRTTSIISYCMTTI